ncbi:MAG TPA: hypothetical protein PKA06_16795, partial [Gemmatales bacterium]|nr:hypothetical protein [Gemmatales bacterium]
DPWFRPVYMTLGPDGNLYIADFYNRIIGHYEVPLTHPGRDRTRGRIWRIVYRGPDAQATPPPHQGDLTQCSMKELVEAWSHPNIAVRMMALQLAVEKEAALPKEADLDNSFAADPQTKAMLLWYRHRRGLMKATELLSHLQSGEELVQVNALKVAAELPERTPELTNTILTILSSGRARTQRAAAEALSTDRQATLKTVQTLMAVRNRVSEQDTHLLHTVRMALRNQVAQLPLEKMKTLTREEWGQLEDITLGIASPHGGRVAWNCFQRLTQFSPQLAQLARHTSRYASEHLEPLHQHGKKLTQNTVEYALLLQAQLQGLREAGQPPAEQLVQDASDYARKLCSAANPAEI